LTEDAEDALGGISRLSAFIF